MFEVNRLTVHRGAEVNLKYDHGPCPYGTSLGHFCGDPQDELIRLNIRHELTVDDARIQTGSTILIADPGTTVTLAHGARVDIGTQSNPLFASEVARLRYGVPAAQTNQWTCDGGFSFRDEDSLLAPVSGGANELTLSVRGGLRIKSRVHDPSKAASWNATGVDLVLRIDEEVEPEEVEAISPDFSGIWFEDSICIKPWASLTATIAATSGERPEFLVIDDEPNSNPFVITKTGKDEALYVNGDVTIHENVSIATGSRKIYYNGDYAGPQFLDPPLAHVTKTLFGDWNNDCAITPKELLMLVAAIRNPNLYDPLMDLDCDGLITSAVERDRFEYNFKHQCDLLPPLCGSCDGGEALSGNLLTSQERIDLAEVLSDTTSAEELADLATKLDEYAIEQPASALGHDSAALREELAP